MLTKLLTQALGPPELLAAMNPTCGAELQAGMAPSTSQHCWSDVSPEQYLPSQGPPVQEVMEDISQ